MLITLLNPQLRSWYKPQPGQEMLYISGLMIKEKKQEYLGFVVPNVRNSTHDFLSARRLQFGLYFYNATSWAAENSKFSWVPILLVFKDVDTSRLNWWENISWSSNYITINRDKAFPMEAVQRIFHLQFQRSRQQGSLTMAISCFHSINKMIPCKMSTCICLHLASSRPQCSVSEHPPISATLREQIAHQKKANGNLHRMRMDYLRMTEMKGSDSSLFMHTNNAIWPMMQSHLAMDKKRRTSNGRFITWLIFKLEELPGEIFSEMRSRRAATKLARRLRSLADTPVVMRSMSIVPVSMEVISVSSSVYVYIS